MHYSLRIIQGRAAEVLGDRLPSPLENDRKMRTVGFYRSAQTVASKLDAATLAMLNAYCQGVNDYIAAHRDALHRYPAGEMGFIRGKHALLR